MFHLASRKSQHFDMIGLELPKDVAAKILYKDFSSIDYSDFAHNMFYIMSDDAYNAYQLRCSLHDFKHMMNFYALSVDDEKQANVEVSNIFKGTAYKELHKPRRINKLLDIGPTAKYGDAIFRRLDTDESPDIFGNQSYNSAMWNGDFESFDLAKIKDFRTFSAGVYELPQLYLPKVEKEAIYSF